VAVLAIALALRKQVRRPARDLLAGGDPGDDADTFTRAKPGSGRQKLLALICLGAGLALVLQALVRADTASAGTFFGAGALWLAAGVLGCAILLRRLNLRESSRRLSLLSLGIRNTGRRWGRSVAVVGLLGCGSFLVAAIGVFRLDAVRDADARASGTGGFALVGEATFPVVQDLNTAEGLELFALDQRDLSEVAFVPLRVRDGDEASCLNLNRARQPRLLGVDPTLLANREAFVFAQVAKGLDRDQGWNLLRSTEGADSRSEVVPAIGDLNSILWAMGRKVGDLLTYTDERGRAFQVQIVGAVANSILQGNLLIDERAFLRLYPSEPGYRMFLVDAPPPSVDETAARLTRGLSPAGVEFTSSTVRLNAFNAVQNTYLGTFQLLGGLGLILGSIGLGILVLRNVLERRGELALLLAVGFRPRAVRHMVIAEHGGLLVAGLGVGMLAAALAVLPNLLSPTAQVPYYGLALTLSGVLISGLVWTWLASATALRGRLLDGLRNE